MMEPLPVGSPLNGAFWVWVVPVLLFLTTFVATWLLYRHFSKRGPNDR
jgi:paraquat-inducible protein B